MTKSTNTFTAMHQTWASVLCSSYFRGAKSRAENQLTSSKKALTDALELHRSLYTKILQLRAIPIFLSFCLCEDLTLTSIQLTFILRLLDLT